MKSLKNIAALAAAAALSLTIASCAGSGAPSPDAAPSGADTPIEELMKIVKGPDFPTGATILGRRGIEEAYRRVSAPARTASTRAPTPSM